MYKQKGRTTSSTNIIYGPSQSVVFEHVYTISVAVVSWTKLYSLHVYMWINDHPKLDLVNINVHANSSHLFSRYWENNSDINQGL